MERKWVELKVLSCRDLKAFNFFHKLSVYAVVSMVHMEQVKKKEDESSHVVLLQPPQKTPVDRLGGKNPDWNHTIRFDQLDKSSHCDDVFLKFELRCEGVLFGNKNIGEVLVPFHDLVEEFNGSVRFVSYEVRNSNAKPNGVLNFSYKLPAAYSNSNIINNNKNNPRAATAELPPLSDDHQRLVVCHPTAEVEPQKKKKSIYPRLDDVIAAIPSPTTPTYDQYHSPVLVPDYYYYCSSPALYYYQYHHYPMQEFYAAMPPLPPSPPPPFGHDQSYPWPPVLQPPRRTQYQATASSN